METQLWEACEPDAEQCALLDELDCLVRSEGLSRKSNGNASASATLSLAHSSTHTEAEPTSSPLPLQSGAGAGAGAGVSGDASYDHVHSSLSSVEHACKGFISNLDDMLAMLEEVEHSHSDVAGRTNVLMLNCEALLEQQRSLQSAVSQLKQIITPFNEVEEVAGQLGIPVDASGRPYSSHGAGKSLAAAGIIDPRSSDFRVILSRISTALKFLSDNSSIKDHDQYLGWLKQLQRRADSLVAKAMLNLLENASKICSTQTARAEYDKSLSTNSAPKGTGGSGMSSDFHLNDTTSAAPALESMLVYSKFRGLGFRMRELGYMLQCSELSGEREGGMQQLSTLKDTSRTAFSSEDFMNHFNTRTTSAGSDGSSATSGMRSAAGDVLATYKQIRCELLAPVLRSTALKAKIDEVLQAAHGRIGASGDTGNVSPHTLCALVRSAFATLFHVAQLEQQLYVTLFHTTGTGGSSGAMSVSVGKSTSSTAAERNEMEEIAIREKEENDNFSEVCEIIDEICSEISGHLRALIIKGSVTVDGLCRVIHTITEDVQSQLKGTRLHPAVYSCLLQSLQRTSSDARERLMYCAEAELRKSVLLFDPLPSQLAYPDILEKVSGAASPKDGNTAASRLLAKGVKGVAVIDSDTKSMGDSQDISRTWYPPLRHSLSLLSLLYGVVDSTVFEDVARRAVAACIDSLIKGAAGVRRWKNQLHGDLFLVRHLLLLREQLLPFNMNLQSIEKYLDFSTTGTALSSFIANSRSLLRMDQSNSLLHLAVDGLPGMHEAHVDVKKKMDEHLKAACQALKYSSIHFLLGPMESFLAKVSAFIGVEIPLYRHESPEYDQDLEQEKEQSVLLPEEACKNLKNQSFVKPDRIKSMLNTVLEALSESYPTFTAVSRLYVENQMTRDIILKPVYQEMTFAMRRMRTIIASCVNQGQERRDLETLLSSVRVAVKTSNKE